MILRETPHDRYFGSDFFELKPLEIRERTLAEICSSLLKEFNLDFQSLKKIREGEYKITAKNKLGEKIECLIWAKSGVQISEEDVEDFYENMLQERAMVGIFITSSHFTKEARKFAKALPIRLVDGIELGQLITKPEKLEISRVFLTDKTDRDAIVFFKKRRRGKFLGLIGNEEKIEYIDRRYEPIAAFSIIRKVNESEERRRIFISLSTGEILRLERRTILRNPKLRKILDLPEETRQSFLDLLAHGGEMETSAFKRKDLDILEKEKLVKVHRSKKSGERSFMDLLMDEIHSTATVISHTTANVINPKESESTITTRRRTGRSIVVEEEGSVKVSFSPPRIDASYDIERFIETGSEINENFDEDEMKYNYADIKTVLENLYRANVRFDGVYHLPYYLCKYRSLHRTRYLKLVSPKFNLKFIPKKTAEYGIYSFIDTYPAIPYLGLALGYVLLKWPDLSHLAHMFSSIFFFFWISIIVGLFLKWIFKTERKVPRYAGSVVKYGFPSIHSMMAVGAVFFISFVDPILTIILIPLGLLYVYSRIVIGVHSVTDVVGGAIIGAIIAIFCGFFIYNGVYLPFEIEAILSILFFISPIIVMFYELSKRY